ncbi:hypothetical protein Pcinc_006044 [Petrolisthes cinctipes]|uniref:DDE-1 domain-containing protein n=1 Tax=Petrolisthes cinctipes TaxID=88211 RepID=A0AAE1GC72_PETCI|nr:hypothetical protein Pcinc_006044 [Petrolisthes cinctipes]
MVPPNKKRRLGSSGPDTGQKTDVRRKYKMVDLEGALDDIKMCGMSIRGSAKKHGIPEATLRHKLSGFRGMESKPGPRPLLTAAEEQILVNYVTQASKRAHPVTKHNVIKTVKAILEEEEQQGTARKRPPSFTGNEPREKWWRLFRIRNPSLTFRKPEALTNKRKSLSVAGIKQWFHTAKDYFVEIDAMDALTDPSRNFNIDESGFSLSPIHGRVLANKGMKHVFEEVSAFHKTNITVLGCIGADGSLPPCMIIYPRKRIHPNIAERFPPGLDFMVGKSEKGYITFETLYEYLCNGFHDWLNENRVKRPVIVWTDWHESRNNYYLAKELNELNIILYGLPPNSTHLMQPLDVAVFGPVKKGWTRDAKLWEEKNTDKVLNQEHFAEVFLPSYYKHVTAKNIKSGFAKCGLVPFDPDMPDYGKLEAAAAQKESASTIYEGVELGGYKEVSSQTESPLRLHRAVQTAPILQVTTAHERRTKYNFTGSMCDLVRDYVGYDRLLEAYTKVPFMVASPVRDFLRTPTRGVGSAATQDVQLPGCSASSTPSTATPTRFSSSSSSPRVSSSILHHKFYPERRPGRGPKIIKSSLDRAFSISSRTVVEELKKAKFKATEKKSSTSKKRVTNLKKKPKRKQTHKNAQHLQSPALPEDLPDLSSPTDVGLQLPPSPTPNAWPLEPTIMTVPLGLHQGPLQPPSPEIGPPSPELGPPYPELGSLSPFIVPLSPELGPPSPELGPPSPELGPPSPELGPPSSELGPPSLAQPPSPELRSCASSSDSTSKCHS